LDRGVIVELRTLVVLVIVRQHPDDISERAVLLFATIGWSGASCPVMPAIAG